MTLDPAVALIDAARQSETGLTTMVLHDADQDVIAFAVACSNEKRAEFLLEVLTWAGSAFEPDSFINDIYSTGERLCSTAASIKNLQGK